MTYPVWTPVRDSHVLNEAFVWSTDRVALANAGDIRTLEAIWASGDFFQTLGLLRSPANASPGPTIGAEAVRTVRLPC